MLFTVYGYKALDFVSDGQAVKGTQLFGTIEESGVVGLTTEKVFVRSGSFSLPEIQPGQTVLDLTYDRRGKVINIKSIDPKSLTLSK